MGGSEVQYDSSGEDDVRDGGGVSMDSGVEEYARGRKREEDYGTGYRELACQ